MVVNALDALPRTSAFEAYQQGRESRNRNALAQLQIQTGKNALAGQTAQMLARGVLDSQDPARDYPLALQQAQAQGMDVSMFPEQWDERAQILTRMAAEPEDSATDWQRKVEMWRGLGASDDDLFRAIGVDMGVVPRAEQPGFMNAGGTVLRTDPNAGTAEPIYTAPEKADHPSGVDEYLFAIANDGFSGTYQDWLAQKSGGKRDIRNDPQGVPRYVDSAEPVFPGVDPKPAKPSSMQEKIDLLTSQGVDPETAAAIATGRYVTSRDPMTGQAQIVDKATGQVIGPMPGQAPKGASQPAVRSPKPATASGVHAPRQPAPQEGPESLYDKAGTATGIVPGMQELATDTLGQLPGAAGEAFQFPETVEDRQALRTAAGNLVRALSVNPRMPVAEIERIREQIRIEPGPMISGEGLQSRMRSIDESLRRNIGTQRALAADPAMPAEARRSAAENSAAMEAFLSELGVPVDAGPRSGNQPGGNLPQPASEQEYQALPGGAVYMAPDGTMRRKPE